MSSVVSVSDAPRRTIAGALAVLFGNRTFQFSTLLVYALFLNHEGFHVPGGNELVYLLYVYKAWHPQFMAADWTFQEPTAGHAFFNMATGWLTLLMPLEWAAWVGRLTCWVFSFVGLMRLGTHFKIPSWCVWLGILLWMIERQALPTTPWTEWMVGSFEAKCPAYVCLIFALGCALRQRPALAGLLAGFSFSFHSAVGLWGGLALGWAVLTHFPIRKTALFCCCAVATALPGLLMSLPLITGPHQITPAESKFLVVNAEPLCLNPFVMDHRYIALLVMIILFNCLVRWQSKGKTAAMIFQFQLALAASFAFGFAARTAGRFDLVKLFPIRVFAVTALLFFFWQLSSLLIVVLKDFRQCSRSRILLACYGLVLFAAIPNPVACVWNEVAMHLHRPVSNSANVATDAGLETKNDFRTAATWIKNNTPEDALVIAPPWRADAFYFLHRPLIANWHAYKYDDMTAWQNRIEALSGDVAHLDPNDADVGNLDLATRSHYRNLSARNIATLQQQFGATWLITTGEYPYPKTFSSGFWSVYQLPAMTR